MPSATPTPVFEVMQRSLQTSYGGDERTVELFVPKLPPGRKAPLVIMLHAYGSNPDAAILSTRFDLTAERYGAIVAFPKSAGVGWNAYVPPSDRPKPNRDTRYLSALLAHLSADLPVDRQRVFVAGFSIGAVMADRVGCEFADRIAAVAIVAGMSWSDACHPSRPVSALIMHGTSDSTFKYALGQSLAERWRRVDDCPDGATTRQLGPKAAVETVDTCAAGSSVAFMTVDGGAHEWFYEPYAPDATELAWQFFVEHPRH
jgi:polyhydroxybutyrate depolymerase